MVPNANLTSDAVPASCATTITPACLQSIYGVPTTSASAPSNTLAVSGYIDEWANEADLKVRAIYRPPLRCETQPFSSFLVIPVDIQDRYIFQHDFHAADFGWRLQPSDSKRGWCGSCELALLNLTKVPRLIHRTLFRTSTSVRFPSSFRTRLFAQERAD